MSAVQPVAILRAEFCVTCSLFRFVSDINGDQIELPYSMIGLVIVLYVARIVSLPFPQLLVVSAFSMVKDFLAFSVVLVMCVC